MKKVIIIHLLLLMSALQSCDKENPFQPVGDIMLTVQENDIKIYNAGVQDVHFFMVERKIAAVLDMILNCAADDPNRVLFRHSKTVSYTDIFGYYERCEVIVYYWHCYQEDSTYVTDGLNSKVVQTL